MAENQKKRGGTMVFEETLSIPDEMIKDACRVLKAVGEKEMESNSADILDEDKTVELIVCYSVEGERKNTPCLISLKYPLFRHEDGDNAILIISNKDTETKEVLAKNPIPGLEKVVVVDKVRKTFARFLQKRDLMKSYKRFLCDESIVPLMPSILGKTFIKTKRHPIPVRISTTSPEQRRANILKGLSSTCLFVNWGPITNVKIGKLSFSEEELVENIRCALPVIFKYINAKTIDRMALMVVVCDVSDE